MEAMIKVTAHLMSRMDLTLRCGSFLLCPHIIGTVPSFLFIRTLIPDLSLPDLPSSPKAVLFNTITVCIWFQ